MKLFHICFLWVVRYRQLYSLIWRMVKMDQRKCLSIIALHWVVDILNRDFTFDCQHKDLTAIHEQELVFQWVWCVRLIVHSDAWGRLVVLAGDHEENWGLIWFYFVKCEAEGHLWILWATLIAWKAYSSLTSHLFVGSNILFF